MTDSKTKLVCVIGKPARHSLSPIMHNAAYSALGINYSYLAFEPENLKKAVEGLAELEVAGFNVTMPFKEQIIKYLDSVDKIAQKIGAVNCVVNSNGKLIGYNTDGVGSVAALKKISSIKGKSVLVLGCGGAGKAIGFYLNEEGASITFSDSSSAKAKGLAKSLGAKSVKMGSIKSLEGFDILINASPVGMKPNQNQTPIPSELLYPGLVVFDVVYDPIETKLLQDAKSLGCKTINGLEMLLEQGFASFELFTKKQAPQEVMRRAILEAIE
ncbi:MAG TPA: shikimate dehydrogenase [archaeon]|nr:shikimate dehydrogenase [archaeon]